MATYKALTGLEYGKPPKRAEAGELVSDIPAGSVKWLLEQGLIEVSDGKQVTKPTTIETEGDDE
ncbi:MAG: hypothetical protein EBU84_12400 [Actinobacteria bacterium]|nr:hypothetical protein [Actinomycetota bacterium]